MLLPSLNGELIDSAIEELDAAVSGSGEDLVLVNFRPCEVV